MAYIKLNSLNKRKDRKKYMTFSEISSIKKGHAHLKVKYKLRFDGENLYGTYRDPQGDYGSVVVFCRDKSGKRLSLFEHNSITNKEYYGAIKFYQDGILRKIKLNIDSKMATEIYDFFGKMSVFKDNGELDFNGDIRGRFTYGLLEMESGNGYTYNLYYDGKFMRGTMKNNKGRKLAEIYFKY